MRSEVLPDTRTMPAWSLALALVVALVLVACGDDRTNSAALHNSTPVAPEAPASNGATSIEGSEAIEGGEASGVLAPDVTPPPMARVEARGGVTDTLEVIVRFGEHAPGPLELYVLDPAVYSESAFRAIRAETRASNAWRFVEELATRLEVAPRTVPGGAAFTIESPGDRATVVARMGDAVGRRRVDQAREGTLELALDEFRLVTRRVTVVDASGRPVAGIPVGVAPPESLERLAVLATTGQKLDVATAPSDAHGAAEVLPRTAESRAFAVVARCLVVAAPVDAPFAVRLPPLGVLSVSFEDSTAVGQVTITNESGLAPIADDEVKPPTSRAVFRGLPLGQGFVVRGETADGRSGAQEVRGPIGADEEVAVVLNLVEAPILVLRLVDEAGAPLPGIKVEVELQAPSRRLASGTSDAKGVLVAPIDPLEVTASELRTFTVVEQASPASRRKGEAGVAVEALVGRIDAGTVVLRGPRVVARGQVVDTDGIAVAGATVELYYDDDPESDVAVGLGGNPRYTIKGTSVRSGDDGTFAIQSAEPLRIAGERMFLRVHAIGKCRFSGLQLEDDGTPLVVTLLAEGTVVVDASAIPKEAAEQLALVLRDAEGEPMAALSLGPAARFAALAPGEYSLALGLGTSDLLRLDGIVVPAGGTSVDPRLSPLALVHPIGERTFELYASDGATIRGARVQYWLSASTPEVRVNVRSSRIAVLDSADILRAAVIVDGYASVEVTRRTDGERLEFVPEVVIDLAFVGLSDRARNAHAKVLRVDSDLPGGDLDGYDQIPSDGVLRLRLPGPGSYQVSLQASYQTIGRYDFEVAPGATRVELDVR